LSMDNLWLLFLVAYPKADQPLPGQTKPTRSALRISALGRPRRFRPATGAPPAAAFETSGIRLRRLNVHITEWTGPRTARQPHLFSAADGSPVLAFAGLWDRWIDPDNFDEVISATIIVSGASAWMRPYHDRMPVLLEPQDFDAWLDGSLGPEALKPAAEEKLCEHLFRAGSTA
jgi:hypothetical protein